MQRSLLQSVVQSEVLDAFGDGHRFYQEGIGAARRSVWDTVHGFEIGWHHSISDDEWRMQSTSAGTATDHVILARRADALSLFGVEGGVFGAFFRTSSARSGWWGYGTSDQHFTVRNEETGGNVRLEAGSGGSIVAVSTFAATSNVGSVAFASGFAGNGWRITPAADAEVQSMIVRGTLSVYELLARRVDAVGGNLLVAPRIKVATRALASGTEGSTGSTYTLTDEFASALGGSAVSDAEVDSYMIAQMATASGISQSVVRVTAKSAATLTVTLNSGVAPVKGLVYVGFDHATDTTKRGSIYMTSRDSGAPFMAVRQGAGTGVFGAGTEHVRLGRIDGVVAAGETLSGYGLVASKARLTDDVVVGTSSQKIVVTSGGIAFTGVGNPLITALNGSTLTLQAARIDLAGVVTVLNASTGDTTRITGNAIRTGAIDAEHITVRARSIIPNPTTSGSLIGWTYETGKAVLALSFENGYSDTIRVSADPSGGTNFALSPVGEIESTRGYVVSMRIYSPVATVTVTPEFLDRFSTARYAETFDPATRTWTAATTSWLPVMGPQTVAGTFQTLRFYILPEGAPASSVPEGALALRHYRFGKNHAKLRLRFNVTNASGAASFASIFAPSVAPLESGTLHADSIIAGQIVGERLSIAATVFSGKNLAALTEWTTGAGRVFLGSSNLAGTRPTVRVLGATAGGVATSFVELFYEADASAWGLRGLLASAALFQLGSTNSIAGWAFTSTRLSNGGAALVSGETLATYGAFKGLLVESGGAARVLVGDFTLPSSHAYTPTDRTASFTGPGFETTTGSVTGTTGAPTASTTSGGWTLSVAGGATASGQATTVRTGSRALLLSVPNRVVGDGFTPSGSPFTATAAQEVAVTAGDPGRVVRVSMWVRSAAGGFVFGATTSQPVVRLEARVSGVLQTVAERSLRDFAFVNAGWAEFVTDVRLPLGATNIKVTVSLAGGIEADGAATNLLYVDDVTLASYDRSVSLLSPGGLAVFASPLGSFRATPDTVDMSAVAVQTLALRLLDSGTTETPPSGQVALFKRGKALFVRWADGSEQQVSLV